MSEIERFGFLSKEESQRAIEEIITYFESERDEEIGMIGAEDILEFFMEKVGPHIYNKGIEDARETVKKEAEETDFVLGVLRKQ